MRRTATQRAYSLILATWFILSGLKPGGMAACPSHDGVPVAQGGAHAAHAPANVASHASGHEIHTAARQHDASSAPEHESHQCTCAGSCCSVTAVELADASAFVTRIVERAAVPIAPARVSRATRADFLLPFPTAPPLALIA